MVYCKFYHQLFYCLTVNYKFADLNKVVNDYISDNDIFTDEQSISTVRAPIERVIYSENLLGTISKSIGHSISDDLMANFSDSCGCYHENFYIFFCDKSKTIFSRVWFLSIPPLSFPSQCFP